MALGGGSLMVAITGMIVPGIPSALFLLFSGHYFLQASATFRRWLEGMPRLGEMVRKLEKSGEMAVDRTLLLKSLGMGILLGLMFLVIHPPLPLVMAIELGLTVFFGLCEVNAFEILSTSSRRSRVSHGYGQRDRHQLRSKAKSCWNQPVHKWKHKVP